MIDYAPFKALSPTTFADVLTHEQIMDMGLRPLWAAMPRVAGPAYPVRCPAGDNLMLHAAIHRAPAGSIIVVEAGDVKYALAGGNVCAVAQQRGIAAFVLDGVIRDLAEIRDLRFPVFARGISPIPGGKDKVDILNGIVQCGGVHIAPQDIVVADEEGIVVIPSAQQTALLERAQAKAAKDTRQTLAEWEAAHQARINRILIEKGFSG